MTQHTDQTQDKSALEAIKEADAILSREADRGTPPRSEDLERARG